MASAPIEDWRLTGQERYLQGVTLKRARWVPASPLNDHDHCEFCWTKFAAAGIPESIQEGYCTEVRDR